MGLPSVEEVPFSLLKKEKEENDFKKQKAQKAKPKSGFVTEHFIGILAVSVLFNVMPEALPPARHLSNLNSCLPVLTKNSSRIFVEVKNSSSATGLLMHETLPPPRYLSKLNFYPPALTKNETYFNIVKAGGNEVRQPPNLQMTQISSFWALRPIGLLIFSFCLLSQVSGKTIRSTEKSNTLPNLGLTVKTLDFQEVCFEWKDINLNSKVSILLCKNNTTPIGLSSPDCIMRDSNIQDMVLCLKYSKEMPKPYSQYKVSFAIEEEIVAEESFETPPGIPGQPRNCSYWIKNETVHLHWAPPTETNGPISGYIVDFKNSTGYNKNTRIKRTAFEYKKENLPDNFRVFIKAYNEFDHRELLGEPNEAIKERAVPSALKSGDGEKGNGEMGKSNASVSLDGKAVGIIISVSALLFCSLVGLVIFWKRKRINMTSNCLLQTKFQGNNISSKKIDEKHYENVTALPEKVTLQVHDTVSSSDR